MAVTDRSQITPTAAVGKSGDRLEGLLSGSALNLRSRPEAGVPDRPELERSSPPSMATMNDGADGLPLSTALSPRPKRRDPAHAPLARDQLLLNVMSSTLYQRAHYFPNV
jgi:hypothetical protein